MNEMTFSIVRRSPHFSIFVSVQHIENLYGAYLASTGITTDSRNVAKGNIFFALKGDLFNGNHYSLQALEQGAKLAVVDEDVPGRHEQHFRVDNCLETLQQLAAHHRNQLDIPVIGLTGSNGKTTTKELIARVLAGKLNTHATSGNLNNHIGVPLTILGIGKNTEIAVIEMGANHVGEIAALCEIARPTHGLITNIGIAHLEGFGSYQGVIRAKTELYSFLGKTGGNVFVNRDDALLMGHSEQLNRHTYGHTSEADTMATITATLPFLEIRWKAHQICTNLYGDYNFDNIMAAISVGEFFGIPEQATADAIATYRPANSRSQLLQTADNRIFLDAYNANPSSMVAAIRNFEQQKGASKVLILGDMLELGQDAFREHLNIIQSIVGKFNTIILIGPEFSKASTGTGFQVFENTHEAGRWLLENPIKGCDILVKGSRGIALEKLLDRL